MINMAQHVRSCSAVSLSVCSTELMYSADLPIRLGLPACHCEQQLVCPKGTA